MSAPLVVNTTDGTVWTRREAVRDGLALYAPEKCGGCPEFVMATYAELEGHGVTGSADVLPVPVGPEPQESGGYPPALPWAALMDDDDLAEFLNELGEAAIRCLNPREALAEVERACGTGRLIAEAQHGHNTAPGPDAVTTVFAERADRETNPGRRAAYRMLAESEGEFDAYLRHPYRVGHDLPETGGTR